MSYINTYTTHYISPSESNIKEYEPIQYTLYPTGGHKRYNSMNYNMRYKNEGKVTLKNYLINKSNIKEKLKNNNKYESDEDNKFNNSDLYSISNKENESQSQYSKNTNNINNIIANNQVVYATNPYYVTTTYINTYTPIFQPIIGTTIIRTVPTYFINNNFIPINEDLNYYEDNSNLNNQNEITNEHNFSIISNNNNPINKEINLKSKIIEKKYNKNKEKESNEDKKIKKLISLIKK